MDTNFKQLVYEIARQIPLGRVSTYGAIAKAIGFPNHSRHVGNAMGGCPKDVPAHRVVAACGVLRVHEFQKKIEAEGIIVTDMKIRNFKHIFWDPLVEIQLP
ncbi:MAG: MGMT family protein [Bacteroidetes bacterium]|nr:MGMT family protein [Bacteroidota bacterium]